MASTDGDWEIVSSCGSPLAEATADGLQALEEAVAGAAMNRFAVSGSSDEEEGNDEEEEEDGTLLISVSMDEQEHRMEADEEEEEDDDDDDGVHANHAHMHAMQASPCSPHTSHVMEEEDSMHDDGVSAGDTREEDSPHAVHSDGPAHDDRREEEGMNARSLVKRGLCYASWIWSEVAHKWHLCVGYENANMVWSLATVAAVFGMVVLGCGWRWFRTRNRKLQASLMAKDKKLSQLMFQVIQMKDTLSKSRRIPIVLMKAPSSPVYVF